MGAKTAILRLVGWATLVIGGSARAAADEADVPQGLSASDWSSIRAAYEANRHAAFAVEGAWQARNPAQQWRTRFDGRGFMTTPDLPLKGQGSVEGVDGWPLTCGKIAGRFHGGGAAPHVKGWSWGLELVSFGRASAERAVQTPVCVEANGGRVEYRWDEALTEWYVNDGRGLEHGYTVHQRPSSALRADELAEARDPDAEASGNHRAPSGRSSSVGPRQESGASGRRGDLQFIIAVRGDLYPRVSGDGRNVTFGNDAGAAVVNYSGLMVFDADGVELAAWFETTSAGLRLSVDDRGARYPLTIDPIAQQAYLKASNTGMGDDFGYSVAVSGDTVVIGAPGEASSAAGINGNQADNNLASSGAAYVFVRSGTTWSQQAYLKASTPGGSNYFGESVAISGDLVVVGAYGEYSGATGINGNQADTSAPFSGAAYVFVRNDGVWSQQAYLKASNTGAFDNFGRSVAVSGDTVVVGASQEDSNATGVNGNQADNNAFNSGAAYVFVRSIGVWSQQAYLKASNTEADDRFGVSVAVGGDTVVVGATWEDSSATGIDGNQADNSAGFSGAAYVFVRSDGVWSQQAYVKASNTGVGDWFGTRVAVSGDTVVVGSRWEDSSATGVNGNQADNSAASSGAAYVFVRSGGVWSQQAYLKASNTGAGDQFGWSLAVSGDTVVVGAHVEDSSATGVNGNQADNSAADSGAAYVFVRSGGVWSQQAYLKASNTAAFDDFGVSVAVSGDTVVVGASKEDSSATGVDGNQADNSATNAGAAYVFTGAGLLVDIVDANPPLDNPFVAGTQPFRDVLQTGATPALTQGIGGLLTPSQDTVNYGTIGVTFSDTPTPLPTPLNITVSCTDAAGNGPGDCPTVVAAVGLGAGPYLLTLSGVIPPGECTTITFAGTNAGQKVQYQYLPGDVNFSGSVSAADVQALVVALAAGQGAVPANLPRYDVNRNGSAGNTDVLRLVGLLNGVNTPQPWLGVPVAGCP